ncbi:MAG: chorismate synthase [Deltaproteobacteria bacterium]|nr:chorismate synthase [Deltaproteobacteria bacterium]MBN2671087.1 chorismate synthase [Deltaproteobacteria bacterium]
MNSFGRIFRVSIYGESHGTGVGVVIDGCPAGIPLSADDFAADIERRRAGKPGTTPRAEKDIPQLQNGVFEGYTTGFPIHIHFANKDTDSSSYDNLKYTPRPGHSDFSAYKKHAAYNDYRGGGHFSGRITVGIVAAGVVAKKVVKEMDIQAKLLHVGGEEDTVQAAVNAQQNRDSVGALAEVRVNNVPPGLGEPFFGSVESTISHLIFSVPGTKGIEFGTGFGCTTMHGSEFNDVFVHADGTTKTNHSGGINGGITNGNEIVYRVAIRPTSSIGKVQHTVNLKSGEVEELGVRGRHDACIALRFPPILEAMTAIALADLTAVSKFTNSTAPVKER